MWINNPLTLSQSDLGKRAGDYYMGGYGSSRWIGIWTRQVVENCLSLDAFYFTRNHITSEDGRNGSGEWRNTYTGQVTNTIGYTIEDRYKQRVIHFQYVVKTYWETKEVVLPVIIRSAGRRFGGNQLLFRCPLTVNGVPCGRLVRKLYLPPGRFYFGCRHCYDLTYRSCQKSD